MREQGRAARKHGGAEREHIDETGVSGGAKRRHLSQPAVTCWPGFGDAICNLQESSKTLPVIWQAHKRRRSQRWLLAFEYHSVTSGLSTCKQLATCSLRYATAVHYDDLVSRLSTIWQQIRATHMAHQIADHIRHESPGSYGHFWMLGLRWSYYGSCCCGGVRKLCSEKV